MRLLLAFLLVLAACRPPGYGRGDPDAAIDGHGGDAHGQADAAIDAPPACVHGFRLMGYATAASAWLSGDFVMWGGTPQAGAIPMVLGVDGGWTVTHGFDTGTFQYKFIVDGTNWILDPTNPNMIDDGMGHTNSVYTCAL